MNNTIQYKNYVGTVEFSENDNLFFGTVIGIKDLVSYEGIDGKSLVEDFHNAVDEYIKLCESENREPEKAFKGSFNIRVSPELHKKSVICAMARNISLNAFVEQALEKAILN